MSLAAAQAVATCGTEGDKLLVQGISADSIRVEGTCQNNEDKTFTINMCDYLMQRLLGCMQETLFWQGAVEILMPNTSNLSTQFGLGLTEERQPIPSGQLFIV